MIFQHSGRGLGLKALALLPALLLPSLFPGSSALLAQEACPNPVSLTKGIDGPLAHVRFLADDALMGREVGSAGARCAGDYIADYLRSLGLEPAGTGGSFFQGFQVQMGSVMGLDNDLTLAGEDLPLGDAWIPFGFSASGTVMAPLIYGGPGVSRPGDPDDRYAHLDIDGKIVVVEGADPHQSGAATLAGDPHFKASVASGRKAAGVIVLLPAGESLPDPIQERRPAVGAPAVALAADRAQAVREAAMEGRSAQLTVSLGPRMLEARNVVALLRGADPTLEREVIILGAHYDHLGLGDDGSLAPDAREVHNGADDNASGTAALMDVARILTSAQSKPARSVLFLAFTGEEKGLWGSGHYTSDPIMPLENTVAMINMDMVGRLRENTLTVYGTGTAEEWPTLLEEVNQGQTEPFELASIPDGYGPSDHSEFYGAGMPVLMLFTNTHSEYHRPEDDWQLINARGLERVAAFAGDITERLAGSGVNQAVALTMVEGAGAPHGGGMPSGEEAQRPSRGGGVYFGTIPDMTPQDFGVRITGVREGSPAEVAGLQGGDVIVELGGKEVSDLYAYTYALREHVPGDKVVVVVVREGERVSLHAVLGERR